MKNALGKVAATLLPIVLFAFGGYMTAYAMLNSPTTVKDALDQSGIYDTAIAQALDNAQQKAVNVGSIQIPVNDPAVQQIIEQSAPPEMIEKQTNGAIDSIYAWLQGKDSKLHFAFDLQDTKTRLANNLAGYTEQHLRNLPVCQGGDMPDPNNPLAATCVPPHFDIAAASARVRDDILHNDTFLEDGHVNAQDITNRQGQSLDQQLAAMPNAYDHVQWGVYASGIGAVILAAMVIGMQSSWRLGLRRFGIIAFVVGIISTGLAWLIGFGMQKAGENLVASGGTALQGSIVKAITLLTHDMRNWWIGYGLLLIVVGIAALIAVRMLRQRVELAASGPAATPSAVPSSLAGSRSNVPTRDELDQAKDTIGKGSAGKV